jgi:hypothetical protein
MTPFDRSIPTAWFAETSRRIRGTRNVDERARLRDAEVRGTCHIAGRATDAFDNRDRRTRERQTLCVERDCVQHAAQRVDDMTRREITRIASTVEKGRPNSRGKRLHDDAPSIPSVAGGASRQREQHVLAAGRI